MQASEKSIPEDQVKVVPVESSTFQEEELHTTINEKEATICILEERVNTMGSDVENYQIKLKDVLTQNDEILLSSQKDAEDFKKEKEEVRKY